MDFCNYKSKSFLFNPEALWDALGTLWGHSGVALRCSGNVLGAPGSLWDALGKLWGLLGDALGKLWDALWTL